MQLLGNFPVDPQEVPRSMANNGQQPPGHDALPLLRLPVPLEA
eukprot:CAMPEP_0204076266 /NCGR_PEP_ID=MMETSP0360-20130528/167615_1 /ASSEMBLY_ACC=CAM_ASM_000342 /TAXON_ID=268821 /ORGANISM="Scrippsiella Hangoei, Strain SHTV-5" /LENGTH=42 /DNA_ID= /DNA_START= /DNA_END= /DNA_ORIENTATION=